MYVGIHFAQMFSSIFFQWSAFLICLLSVITINILHMWAMNKRPISNVCIENSHKLSFAFIQGLWTPNEVFFFIEIPSGQFDTQQVTSLPGYWGDNLGEACRGQFGGQFEKYRHKNSPLHSFLEQSF